MVVGRDHVGIVFPFRFEFFRRRVGNRGGSDAGDRLDLGFLENRIPIGRLGARSRNAGADDYYLFSLRLSCLNYPISHRKNRK